MNILQEAEKAVYGDREADYGSVLENFTTVAKLWSVVAKVELTPEQVGLMMVQLKVARQMNKPKRDNLVDGAGYFATLEKMEEERKLILPEMKGISDAEVAPEICYLWHDVLNNKDTCLSVQVYEMPVRVLTLPYVNGESLILKLKETTDSYLVTENGKQHIIRKEYGFKLEKDFDIKYKSQ